MGDAYLRTGRGGAGNFYSQKDVEDAVKGGRKDDIEAQILAVPARLDDNGTTPSSSSGNNTASSSSSSTPHSAVYARSGRGGAGNFVPASSTTTSTPTQVNPPHPQPQPHKSSGRGGAGNFVMTNTNTMSEEARKAAEEQDARRKEALDAGLAREIRESLPQMPARTYHLHGPGRGRRKSEGEEES
ncbi:hypothetical protein F5Y17DRAFT_440277 [Xylariaceae sp. FL0594]|nr:hypothetical protein F5Y17DRAFT_440277 [Xylariaceae sp. FL0594]